MRNRKFDGKVKRILRSYSGRAVSRFVNVSPKTIRKIAKDLGLKVSINFKN